MYLFGDHKNLFHLVVATKSCATNMYFYKFSSFESWLVKTLASVGSNDWPSFDGNMHSMHNNMDVIHKLVGKVCDLLQP
jgi:hypothetical protein